MEEGTHPRAGDPAPNGGATLPLLILVLATLLASSGGFLWLDRYPPFVDYDVSTEGILVNNHSYQDAYDHYFASPPKDRWEEKNLYRADLATFRLPFSMPVSWLQRLLGVGPTGVVGLMKVLAAVFAILTAALFAWRFLEGRSARLFFVGALLVHPSLLLVMRTGVAFWTMILLSFWLAVCLLVAYCRSGRPAYLYALAPVMAWLGLNPYPPVLALPIAFVAILWLEGRLLACFRQVHVYAAAALGACLFLAASYGLALAFCGDLDVYLASLQEFAERRGIAISFERHLFEGSLVEKLTKLVNQHALFRWDDLGDFSRSDEPWTLGVLHVPYLILMLLAGFGLVAGLRRREPNARVLAAVLFSVYLVFFTVSFPEGRYILVVVPCYVYLASDFLCSRVLPRLRGEGARVFVLALLLLVLTGETYRSVTGSYSREMLYRWGDQAGVAETVAHLPAAEPERERVILLPGQLSMGQWLHYNMRSNFEPVALPWPEFSRRLDTAESGGAGPIFYMVLPDPVEAELTRWEGRGFREVASYIGEPTRRRFTLLERRGPAAAVGS